MGDNKSDQCFNPGFFANGGEEDFKQFSRHAHTVNLAAGVLNSLILVVLVVYIAAALIGNSKFATTKWICITILSITVAFVAAGQLFLSKARSRYCNFSLHMIFSVDTCLLFNISMVVAYQVYSVTNDILEYCQKGILPSESSKRRNKRFLSMLWIISILVLLIQIFMNSWFWIGNNGDFETLSIVVSIFQLAQTLLALGLAMTYSYTHLLAKRTLTFSIPDSQPWISLVVISGMIATYSLLFCTLVWHIFVSGTYGGQDLACHIIITACYISMKLHLFYILANQPLEMRLMTQVL